MQLLFIPMQTTEKKVHGVVLVVLLSRLPTFCVFNVVVNHSIFVVKGLNPGVSSLSNESALQSTVTPGGGGGDTQIKKTGMHVGNF